MPGETGLQLDTTEFNRMLGGFRAVSHDESVSMITGVAETILSAAQRRTPIKTGFLQNSGTRIGDELTHEIGFNASYAAAVHERTEIPHAQGEAKYLERAIQEEGPGILERAVAGMRTRLEARVQSGSSGGAGGGSGGRRSSGGGGARRDSRGRFISGGGGA